MVGGESTYDTGRAESGLHAAGRQDISSMRPGGMSITNMILLNSLKTIQTLNANYARQNIVASKPSASSKRAHPENEDLMSSLSSAVHSAASLRPGGVSITNMILLSSIQTIQTLNANYAEQMKVASQNPRTMLNADTDSLRLHQAMSNWDEPSSTRARTEPIVRSKRARNEPIVRYPGMSPPLGVPISTSLTSAL